MPLEQYREKRDFCKTAEPAGKRVAGKAGHSYLIQKHDATRLHYDLRLELDGVLLSWAVPKGPSLNPADKRLAVHVEDHPIEYGTFEGTIPKGQYGGGTVMLWDRGWWEPVGDARTGMKEGKLKFILHGERLHGEWTLVRMHETEKAENWLLIKEKDENASVEDSLTDMHEVSVSSGRSMEEIAGKEKQVGKQTLPRKSQAKKAVSSKGRRAATTNEAPFPHDVQPQLASLVTSAPRGEEWVHELKFDGYRLFVMLENGKAVIRTARGEQDWTHRFRNIAKVAEKNIHAKVVLDGEAIVVRPDGTSDFQALQNSMSMDDDSRIVYYAFDILYLNGRDLRDLPLIERKKELEQLLAPLGSKQETIRFSKHIEGSGDAVLSQCCKFGMEGIISKRAASPYLPVRNRNWVKVKCTKRQEFVIGGFSTPQGSRSHFGAILLGYHDDKGSLQYAGRIGTGFDEATLQSLAKKFAKATTGKPPFANPPRGADARGVTWLEPRFVAEAAFAGWTDDGIVRQGVFLGLREDKVAKDVHREKSEALPPMARTQSIKVSATSKPGTIAGVALTNPQRVLYPKAGTTKHDLAIYYESIAERILPHVANRPLALVRCPDGRGGQCFFQKHLSQGMDKHIKSTPIPGKDDVAIHIENVTGLIELVQFSTMEIHTWGCHIDKMDRPDLLVFDLDPGEETPWQNVIDGAVKIRSMLEAIDLQSFAKTSGGKGLHVCLPIERRISWEDLKDFAHDVALVLEKEDPSRYISTATKARRKGRIFVDYLRNGEGATCVAPYSSRGRDYPTVSMPISWEEVEAGTKADEFQLTDALKKLSDGGSDPWKEFLSLRQSLTASKRRQIKDSIA